MGKTVEQIYQKKTQHEHILTRPDMYIGTIEPVTDDMWVYDEAECIMKQRKCTWIPGLYKIFDEILVNAADNKVRDPEGQTTLKVRIEETHVSVYNNGIGIPVAVHQKHGIRVPEMIFGHLLTSSNYDDDEAKVTGGRNGFGAKLTNVFSTRFEVETVYRRSKFYMRWTNNMLEHGDAVVTTYDGDDYTKVTFYPDFARFHVERFSEDMMLMMKRRVYDVAGCTDKSLKCYLNGNRIELKNFQEYVDLYPTMGEERQRASYARVNDRWEVCVRISNMGFQQVSFVNSIATTRGGTHVKYILDQVITKVTDMAKKKNKVDVKPHMVRPHLFIFVNCLIENPGFDSQTKETLNTVKGKFGSTCDLPNSLIDCVLKSGLVDRSVEMANSKLTKELAAKMRTSDRRQILGIPKLDDANEAGGKQSHRCTLILTEGDSAKTLCTAGLAVKDRDFFGVFPLRGKPLNVRDATLKKVMQNEEVQCVMKIMGLDIQKKYHSVDGLRYGHLMIMSDQDHDGSHIKGLIINFIHHYWPELLNINGFLQQFITPIVKARKNGRGNEGQAISFFSMPDYLDWKRTMGANVSHYDIRYYKGLGTSGAKEGREYFENIDRHRLTFIQEGPQDPERIVMAFAKDKVEDRKDWITSFKTNTNPAETVDYTAGRVTYQEFIDKELILFSVADCERSIPSVIDGFKPGQRKILFCCFKRNLSKAIKVVQLAGYVSEHAAYHHGEQSLVQTIVALAQDFVGSNNAPLLQQDGQFGTRLQGGRDHAAGRYIFTRLAQLARCVYHPDDDFVVEYRDDDGLSVEPFFYMPVIPMVLVNGTSGIGTGFSTNIPNYNPIEIIDNLKRLMRGEPLEPMQPWYFGFTGTMEEREKGKFISHGKYTVQPDGVVSITELPVNVWTQNYKKFLEELREKEFVVQYRDHNTDVSVDFDVVLHPQVLQQWMEQNVLEEKLQLREFVHATNIIAFNQEGQIAKYPDAESVLREFYHIRLNFYSRRKDYLLGDLRRLTSKLENMVRFVREVVEGRLTVTRRKKKELLEELRQRQYVAFPPQSKKKMTSTTIQEEADEGATAARAGTDENLLLLAGEEDEVADSPEVQRASRDYDYLLGMRLWNLTAEMIDRLEAQLRKAKNDTEALEKRSPMDLWMTDLDVLRPKLLAYYAEREKEIASTHRKKMEKKKPFNVARLRMPLLSDKARKLLEKEAEKAEKQTGRRPAVDGMTAGDVAEGVPRRRAAPKRRRVKRERSDDDDDSLDESWLYSNNSDGADESDGGGSGHKRSTTAAVKEEADGGADMASSKPSTRRAPRAAKTSGGTNGSSRPARRVRTEPTKVEDTDDFDIDGFGLDALGVPPSAPAMSVRPAVNGANGGSAPQVSHAASRLLEDDDDLLLLGIPPPSARATGPASAPAKAAPKQAPRKSAPKAAAAKKRKRVSSSSDDLSELDDDGDDTSSESSGSFSDSYDDAD